jgi:hypothetical protein
MVNRRYEKQWVYVLFGNLAVLNLRIHGFASPDYSGFAFIADTVFAKERTA